MSFSAASLLQSNWHAYQGHQFEAGVISVFCKFLKIKKTCTTPHHPQGDHLVERLNRTLVDMLSAILKEQPFPLMFGEYAFGHEAHLPLDIMYGTGLSETSSYGSYASGMRNELEETCKCIREKLATEHSRQKYFYDQKCHAWRPIQP